MLTSLRKDEEVDVVLLKELKKNPSLFKLDDLKLYMLLLKEAAGLNRLKWLRKLLDEGDASKHVSPETGNQVLHFASLGGHVEACTMILDKYPTLLDKVNHNRDTPLMLALLSGHWNVASYLISRNADVLTKNMHDMRAAHCLCGAEPPTLLVPLIPCTKNASLPIIEKGIDKKERWKLLRKVLKPLLSEITENEQEANMCTIFILKEYTNKNQELFVIDPNWRLAQVFKLRLEIRMRQRAALLKRILTLCPRIVHERDRRGNTPLLLAAVNAAGMATIDTLLKFGADTRARNNRGVTVSKVCAEFTESVAKKKDNKMTVKEFYEQSTNRALMIAWGHAEGQARAAADRLLLQEQIDNMRKKNQMMKNRKGRKIKKSSSPSSQSVSPASPKREEEDNDDGEMETEVVDESKVRNVTDVLAVLGLESFTLKLMSREIGVEDADDLVFMDDEVLKSIGMKEDSDRSILLSFVNKESGGLADWLRQRRIKEKLSNTLGSNDGVGWTTYRRKGSHRRGEKKAFGASLMKNSINGKKNQTILKKKHKDNEKQRKVQSSTKNMNKYTKIKPHVEAKSLEKKKNSVKFSKMSTFASAVSNTNSVANVITKKTKTTTNLNPMMTTSATSKETSMSDLKAHISSNNARLDALDIEPKHITGMSLESLSIAQLEILQEFHLNQVSEIMKQKVLKTQDLEVARREEFERLQTQIRQLSDFTRPSSSNSLI